MKKIKFLVLALALLLLSSSSSFALTCSESRLVGGSADDCYTAVVVASNETTLVSNGTVLNYDVTDAQFNSTNSAFQVRVVDASADGAIVAGVAQRVITSGEGALILVRGRGDVAVKNTETIVSGNALFVSTSGDASLVTSTTQTPLGFALDNQTAAAPGGVRNTRKAYITIV